VTLTDRPMRLPFLRLVPPRPAAHVEVRVSVAQEGAPFGRSRLFRLNPLALDELLAAALGLESRA
jgi:hypothetical protein